MRVRWTAVVLALALTPALTGCARITVRRHAQPLPMTETVTERRDEYAWGLLSFQRAIDLQDRCPGRDGGWETLTLEQRPLQMLLRTGTLGIYSPWTLAETCSARR